MNAIHSISTPIRFLDAAIARECALVRKRATAGLTFDEATELLKLQREAYLRQQALDAIAEANAEGRIPHYHDLPVAKNFHD